MSGYEIYNNTFKNCYVGTFIGGGRRNYVHHNHYYDCTIAVHVDNRGMNWQKSFCSPVSFYIMYHSMYSEESFLFLLRSFNSF